MSHLTEGALQSYLDREVSIAERADVEAHLRVCGACAAQLDELRDLTESFTAVLRLADRGTPGMAGVLAEVKARGLAEGRGPWRERFAFSRGALLKAAMLVLGLATAASAVVPESPVRKWVGSAWREVAGLFQESEEIPAAPVVQEPAPVQPDPAPSGISLTPSSGRVRIVVQSAAPGTRIHVRLVDTGKVSIEATGGASTAAFSSAAGRLEVVGGGVGDLTILLPRGLRNATLVVDGRLFLTKNGAELKYPGLSVDTVGGELIFQTGR